MRGFAPVANSFKKKTAKPSRPPRASRPEGAPRDGGLPAKKHAGGLRSPKGGPSTRSQGPPRGRPGRTPAPAGGPPPPRRGRRSGADVTIQEPGPPGRAPRGTKKRGRSDSRTIEAAGGGAGGSGIAEGRQAAGGGDDTVKVVVRIRPSNAVDERTGEAASCLRQLNGESLAVVGLPERAQFSYDAVAGPDVGQEPLFQSAGRPVVENCLAGYNSCVFAYGQTGSGKTHTMLGDLPGGVGPGSLPQNAGLMPRIFAFLFDEIAARQAAQPGVEYTCSCSLLEIYNEMITDLLGSGGGATNLQVREDITTGVYVEGLTVETVESAQGAMDMLRRGSANRHVGETAMNVGSSRSHCVLTCVIESKATDGNGFTNVLSSRLNLVDLAGSERQKTSGTAGGRLREASSINKSLSTLGLVIMSLMDAQQRGRRTKHVPYRDSKLTFLLQDSLGGNSKTVMIANVSPSPANMGETLSTLRFARRAKFIKNRAVVNEDLTADAGVLKQEIARLNQEVARYRAICEAALAPGDPDHPGTSGRQTSPDSSSNSARSGGRDATPRSARSARSTRSSAKSSRTNRADVACRDGWGAQHAYDLEELRSRAEMAASQAVSAASLEIEQAMARAEEDRRAAEVNARLRAERDAGSIRDLRSRLGANEAAGAEGQLRLAATAERNAALADDNARLEQELVQAREVKEGLAREKAALEGQLAAKMAAEAEAEEACLEANWAKDRLAAVCHEKHAVEARLQMAVADSKDLYLRNKELEELVVMRDQALQEAQAGPGGRAAAGCAVMDSDEDGGVCSCGMEILRLEGELSEEREGTYRLKRELEILTLQQDEEFCAEFGSFREQLATLLKKLEDANNELNHLKHTLVERDSEVKDRQEFVDATWAYRANFELHREFLEEHLREALLEREDLLGKVRGLEGELDGLRHNVQQGLAGDGHALVESLQSELQSLRQENGRLSCRMEDKSSEAAVLRAELAAMRACSGAQSPASARDVGYQAFGGRSPSSPAGWAADRGLERNMAQADSRVAHCAGSTFPDEMDLDECETEASKACCLSGDGLGALSGSEVACR